MMVIMVSCMALLGAMQAMATTFSPAKPQPQTQQQVQPVYMETAAPSATFRSTSVMAGSGSSYTPTPVLNENGTVNEHAYAGRPARPGLRRDPGIIGDEGENESSGDTGLDDGTDVEPPVGDGLWPLMFLALAFAGYVALRRRRALSKK